MLMMFCFFIQSSTLFSVLIFPYLLTFCFSS
uniref:Uncharacterized protein n=1 Tax=Rhizophora mucronata TaxID=61149 RepID=A0A2P2N6B5_RHIMU